MTTAAENRRTRSSIDDSRLVFMVREYIKKLCGCAVSKIGYKLQLNSALLDTSSTMNCTIDVLNQYRGTHTIYISLYII